MRELIVGSAMQYSIAAAAASRICMQPSGTMDLTGMSMTQFVIYPKKDLF